MINLQYHIYESNIKCPYCDRECYDDDCEVAQNLGAYVDFECTRCEKVFFAESSVVYSTYSDCNLNGEEHDFEASKTHPTVFNCKRCYKTEVR